MSDYAPIKISEADYADCQESSQGICLSCHAYKDCCEPDARQYECDECGEHQVYGAEELLIMGKIEFTEEDE